MTLTSQKLQFLFHYICYYVAWLLGVEFVAANHGLQATALVLGITGLQVAWQFAIARRTHGLLLMVFILTLTGFLVDSIFIKIGVIVFNANPWLYAVSPPWMMSLWISFAVTYYAVMDRFWDRYFLVGILSLFAFPAVYYAGIRLGVATLPKGVQGLAWYGLVWCILLPLCDYVYCNYGVIAKSANVRPTSD